MKRRFHSSSASAEGLFRFRVVSEALTEVTRGRTRCQAVHLVASRSHACLDGGERKVSTRTLYRWLAAYERGGFGALEPAERRRVETSVVLSEALVAFLREEKTTDPLASVPELIERARERGKLARLEEVDRTSVVTDERRVSKDHPPASSFAVEPSASRRSRPTRLGRQNGLASRYGAVSSCSVLRW